MTESSHHSASPSISQQRKQDSIVSAYANEFASQLDLLLRYAKRPFVALIFIGFFGVLLSVLTQKLSGASQFPGPYFLHPSNSSYRHASYADFPTLMNIESSFEKIVDSAAGGSALARVMKQSEMAVSDLSTVVRYSELKCKETLSERLDVFARDAKGNVRALQGFGSKVGGVLDQCVAPFLIPQFPPHPANGLRQKTPLNQPICPPRANHYPTSSPPPLPHLSNIFPHHQPSVSEPPLV